LSYGFTCAFASQPWPARDPCGASPSLRVAQQALLARFEKLLAPPVVEVLAPPVVEVRDDAFAAAQRGDALLAPQALDHDPDLFLGGKPPSRLAPDLPNGLLGRCLFLLGFRLLPEPGTLS
jgi:hypothetical protein